MLTKIPSKYKSLITLISSIIFIQSAHASMTHEWWFKNNMLNPVTVEFIGDRRCFNSPSLQNLFTVYPGQEMLVQADDINSGTCFSGNKVMSYTTTYVGGDGWVRYVYWKKTHGLSKHENSKWYSYNYAMPAGFYDRNIINVQCGVDGGRQVDCSIDGNAAMPDRNSPSWVKTTFYPNPY